MVMAWSWHTCGMARTRISTTVDRDLLDAARKAEGGATDAELVGTALAALIRQHRRAEIDAGYELAYAANPIDGADEWGDLASFREAAGSS